MIVIFFFFNDTATTEIYTLSLHDALPICLDYLEMLEVRFEKKGGGEINKDFGFYPESNGKTDRKSTRLNSSHANISYAVFCLKKKNKKYLSVKCRVYKYCRASSESV